VLAASVAGAGRARAADAIRIEVEFFEGDSASASNRATVWTSDRRVRIEQRPSGGAASPPVFLYRGDEDLLFSVDRGARSFVRIERRTLDLLGGGARSARGAVARQLDAVPEDQQRAFGHLLGTGPIDATKPEAPLVVAPMPGSGSVAGFPCRRVALRRATRLLAEGCVADWATVGLAPEDVEVFRALARLTRDAMGGRAPIPIELVPGQPLDLVVQLGGFPLAFERAGRAREASAIRVASVERVDADAALFAVPSGFTPRSPLAGLAGLPGFFAKGAAAPARSPAAVPAAPDPAYSEATPSPHASDAAAKRLATDSAAAPPRPASASPRRAVPPFRTISLFGDWD